MVKHVLSVLTVILLDSYRTPQFTGAFEVSTASEKCIRVKLLCYALLALMYSQRASLDNLAAPYKHTATKPAKMLPSTPALSPM